VLSELLSLDVFRFLLVFTRLGTAMMLMPGFGGTLISTQIRLLLALSISFVVMPTLSGVLPSLPKDLGQMVLLVGSEAAVGLFLGTVIQVLLTALNLAGTMVGFQTGLTNAFSFDPISQQQSQLLTGFMSNLALVTIFASDLHHLMLRAVVDSYAVFRPGMDLPLGDFAETLGHMLTEAFRLGLQLSAPLTVFGLVFYTGLGVLSRLVPQMQVFFVSMPIQALVGMWLVMVSLPIVMMLFLSYFAEGLAPYLIPG
jgi:flagellar biosynthetic protein FliR